MDKEKTTVNEQMTAEEQIAPEQIASEQAASAKKTASDEKQEKTKQAEKIRRAERSVKDYQYLIFRLLILAAALWVLFFVFIGVMHMPTTDMSPRIDAGDMILYYRLDKDVKSQDVIVVEKKVPGIEGMQILVLRVVATAGDTVDISEDEHLIINGNQVVEPNIFYNTPKYEGYVEFPLTLGEGECFVLADSRRGGTDSRFFGPVNRDEIVGTVITILRRNNL